MNKEIRERIECIKNNQLPKGYRRIKDIGIAPEDWTLGKMSDVIENVSRPVSKPNEPYWRLGIKSWAKGTFHAFVDDPETVNMDELYEVKENDLIVNITFAWEHAIAIAKKEDDGLLVSHRFPTYVFKEGQVPEYYQAVITQRYFKDMLDHISPGGAGRNRVLNRKAFLNLPCNVPSEKEQKKIAEILSVCNAMVDLEEKYIRELLLLKKIYMKQFFFAREEEQIFFSQLYKKAGEGGTPETKISEYYNSDDIPFVKIEHLYNKYINHIDSYISYLGLEKSGAWLIPKNSLIFSNGATIGEASINKISVATKQGILGIIPSEIIDVEYFYYLVKSDYFLSKIRKITTKGTMYTAYLKDIDSIRLFVHDAKEQKKIAELLSSIDELISVEKKYCEQLVRKKMVLQKFLINGIVRV